MYHPYFRGKQYELVTVREMAPLFKQANFRPIVEPVRETLSGLSRALDEVDKVDGQAVVIVNPHHGDLSGTGGQLTELLKERFLDRPGISAGILLKQNLSLKQALGLYREHSTHSPVFIHAGFADAKALAEALGTPTKNQPHIFLENYCGKLYQKHFKDAYRVLLRDGFQRKRGRDYDAIEPFSDLHATFQDEGMDGFGDFLTVGDEYSETGGPAYTVVIHLTFINHEQDDTMQIYHFKSKRQDTPTDPAGKFAEALDEMMKTLQRPDAKIFETNAMKELKDLHRERHFPGLGYVKKLSMSHHIETLANDLRTTS